MKDPVGKEPLQNIIEIVLIFMLVCVVCLIALVLLGPSLGDMLAGLKTMLVPG